MDSSSFSRLSPELRNRVYEFSLTHTSAFQLQDIKHYNAMTRTCRQIRAESHLLFLANSDFTLDLSCLRTKWHDPGDHQGNQFAARFRLLSQSMVCSMRKLTVFDYDYIRVFLGGLVSQNQLLAGLRAGRFLRRGTYYDAMTAVFKENELKLRVTVADKDAWVVFPAQMAWRETKMWRTSSELRHAVASKHV